MKPSEYQHLKKTIYGRIQLEVIRRSEERLSEPIALIMHPETYSELLRELYTETHGIAFPEYQIHGIPIMISHKIKFDLGFVYKESMA